ncbi:protein ROOT HAIR SPECIFIC 17 isoform X2 [Gossypium hirsutum]|uniref:O-fucosyltransferase family protein n=1 Tax=Gossypium hirsutum TaxID=3635 RepID=A0ABM3BKQ7_GOSHI|nr:protein ROOT HAIR SPECIFIC 17-like isoform X2 [Gossypium hirsutum]
MENIMTTLKELKRLIFSLKIRRKKSERNNTTTTIHLHGSNGFYIGLKLIFWRKHRRVFSFISAISGCLLLLLFSSVYFPPPTANNLFLPRHSSVRHVVNVREALEYNFEAMFQVPASGGNLGRDLWSWSQSTFYYGCSNASKTFQTANRKKLPDRYLLIATSGGLNQQRTGIIDAVVAAYILNATLVIPRLDQQSYWKDTSCFAEIFDVNWFISYLSRDVEIIKELPPKGGKAWIPRTIRVPRKCDPTCYETRVLPVLNRTQAVELTKFDYRLSNRLDTELQKLRCRVNYHALRFTDPILKMGKLLVERMKMKAKYFIALHLRFEPDMLAFSGCYYGGGDKERAELGAIRKRWKTLHASNPEKVRRNGKCPLTPEEVGLMLRALGFGSDVHIYVASGRMAALDYIVCDETDVFVANNNGNMARMLAGRRRYFGHKPTIRPNARKLYKLFLDRNNMTWEEFSSRVRTYQIGFMGEPNEMKPGKGEFHENPDSCLCQARGIETIEEKNRKDAVEMSDEYQSIEDPDWIDVDYLYKIEEFMSD